MQVWMRLSENISFGRMMMCRLSQNWLAAFLEAFRRWPDAVVFGGKITLHLLPPTPLWFLEAFDDLKPPLEISAPTQFPFP
jgi:hypothetical protein